MMKNYRCNYQCNVPPNQQARGTQRCKRTDTKLVLLPSGGYSHRCTRHQQKRYLAAGKIVKLDKII